ncbi:M20 family metallopeptidase [Candidatus Bipolaricaulota bacterium]|nr:M20 family metallopeptidase [Candidatus Bipolaricaulota bacterium]
MTGVVPLLRIDEEVRQEAVELLQTLVGIRSANPPGSENEIATVVKEFLVKNGIDVTIVPLEKGRSSVVARIRGAGSGSVVLCGHLDTVNANEQKWSVPPFEPRIDQERMWGLGSADMKSGVVVILEMAKLIAQNNLTLKKDLVLALTADEESAYRGAASVTESGLIDDAQFLIIAEPTAGKVYCGQKGELWLEVEFSGKAAHGSLPDLGVNAILPAARFCLDLAEAANTFREHVGRGHSTVNIGQFNGGWQVNIVPDTTKVRLDSRVVSDEEKRMVVDLVQRLGQEAIANTGAGFRAKTIAYRPPIVSDTSNPYVQSFLEAAAGNHSQAEMKIAPYSTDGVAIIPRLGIPMVVYGPGNIAQAHRPDEFLELFSLYEALDVFARFFNGLVSR